MNHRQRAAFDIDLVLAKNDDHLVRFITVAQRFGLIPDIPGCFGFCGVPCFRADEFPLS